MNDNKTVNLALQGGGSHGAFTWGVLDALLEDGRLDFDGISGASAGAMNAVALAHGFAQAQPKTLAAHSPAVSSGPDPRPTPRADPRERARESLAHFWGEVVQLGAVGSLQRNMLDIFFGGWQLDQGASNFLANAVGQVASPYQTNPLDINPLRDLLERTIDFEHIAHLAEPKVFVSATHVTTGKAEIFSGKRLTAASVMASACLPMLFRAVEIDGEAYWDGGYSGNPAIHPLIYRCQSSDILLVQINPLARDKRPNTAHEILDRVNELTFNASLLAQMRAIDFVNRLLQDGRLHPGRYRPVMLHRIDGGETLEAYSGASRASADAALIDALFKLGRAQAHDWLKHRFGQVGVKSTINIERDYLDDMRLGNPQAHPTV